MGTPKFMRITDVPNSHDFTRSKNRYDLSPYPDCKSCTSPIWFTAFFDGTNNNFYQDGGTGDEPLVDPDLTKYTNIAKLWQFAHKNPNGEDTSYASSQTKAAYIQGVGTPCKEVGDPGGGFGAATAAYGEARINWMLDQLAEHVRNRKLSYGDGHLYISQINLAVFGFSRGATQARAFVRKLADGKLASVVDGELRWHQPNRDGIRPKIHLYFMGLIDTVAGVGYGGGALEERLSPGLAVGGPVLGQVLGSSVFGPVGAVLGGLLWLLNKDGHDSWADDLRIPAYVQRCVHLVASHEVRERFPLDSVREDDILPGNCVEDFYPGVHSDVGGGYERNYQENRSNELANIALARLYVEAWQAGVPLKSPDEIMASPAAELFAISPELEQLWMNYMAQDTPGEKMEIQLISHMNRYYRWRAGRTSRLGRCDANIDWRNVDAFMKITDKEWADDIVTFAKKRREVEEQNKEYLKTHNNLLDFRRERGIDTALTYDAYQAPSPLEQHQAYLLDAYFKQQDRDPWEGEARRQLDQFFDRYVHDSIAGFKQVLANSKKSYVESSRWSVNRRIFVGKRDSSYLYWRYEGKTPEIEEARVAAIQQEREKVLAQENARPNIARTG
ncbi:phospholipase effector Tle1 domain-containing protein [Herbaspirillum sp. RV1423]|uniref:phospholipase effector Tle1 domain-containing protein n=1 Tax=Herbaspirillum sp. RV1423 TaxID=1443993 RepID=UPI0004BA7EAB|nr:DUF2235 domain-containing protein [Herbaspirillum sp. RV1423]